MHTEKTSSKKNIYLRDILISVLYIAFGVVLIFGDIWVMPQLSSQDSSVEIFLAGFALSFLSVFWCWYLGIAISTYIEENS